MQVNKSFLTYCTNIHSGENWTEHFEAIKKSFPLIKKQISPNQLMGIGLRLSNTASLELMEVHNLQVFQKWLSDQNACVFTMNGFPYGDFHNTRVKDHVHTPDWTTNERVDYTSRLFTVLAELLPEDMDGGVSTSPLSYRYWHTTNESTENVKVRSTENILKIAEQLIQIKQKTEKILHLDIEPEPDGLLETGEEFIQWFEKYLIPIGIKQITGKFNLRADEMESILKEHIRICYDVCHFAIGYEDHSSVITKLKSKGIQIGKIQISSALKADLTDDIKKRNDLFEAFSHFNESTYLHQVVALKKDNSLIRYRDLPVALKDIQNENVKEWRSHFHVPVFLKDFGLLYSTQNDILEVIKIHNLQSVTNHIEVETYTWEVLPAELKVSIKEPIVRELEWVIKQLV